MEKIQVRARRWGTAVAAVSLLAACGTAGGPAAGGSGPAAALPPSEGGRVVQADDTSCDPTRSVPPSGTANGGWVRTIQQRGKLVVGVDQNAFHWGARDTVTGQLEGFDIDLVHALAKALAGSPDAVQFISIPAADRIPALQSHRVDLVVRALALTCDRKKQIGMSTAYFHTGHQAIVRATSKAQNLDQALRGQRVCVTAGATEEAEIAANPHGNAGVVKVGNEVDCLVQLQLGDADAIFTDGAYGAALVAQDASVRLVDHPYSDKYFGVGVNLGDTDLLARVNQVLEDYRSSGAWTASYDHWLEPYLGTVAGPPAASYQQ
ncbi:transporter substrate-binding domain-containing protein [Kitasatospora sp. NPDC006697]|uniref:transporter substrate-binding domain-containing protein n=1 Tax=Kitasatospora sp. NPDC006697 TaxID=3364020 RepID=UPI0036ADE1B1